MKKLIFSLLAASLIMASCQNKQTNNASEVAAGNETVAATTVDTGLDNPVIQTIMSRHSVRAYKPEPVSRDKMDVILKCGINAPSGNNNQPWEVRVVDNPEFIYGVTKIFVDEMMKNPQRAKRVQDPNFKNMFNNAPTVIFVAGKKDGGQYDCGLLTENMLIAAQSMGLATCCMGSPAGFMKSPPAKEYLDKLGFSADYELIVTIAVGTPDETPAASPRDASKVKYVE
ncbi:MAG: nitroreductase [Tannerella sp.]|jgi:nitroreductase|nr:nitroreductase [Tannerella sp.]